MIFRQRSEDSVFQEAFVKEGSRLSLIDEEALAERYEEEIDFKGLANKFSEDDEDAIREFAKKRFNAVGISGCGIEISLVDRSWEYAGNSHAVVFLEVEPGFYFASEHYVTNFLYRDFVYEMLLEMKIFLNLPADVQELLVERLYIIPEEKSAIEAVGVFSKALKKVIDYLAGDFLPEPEMPEL